MGLYHKGLEEYKKGLSGYSTIFIIAQSCLGSVAAMYILMNGVSPVQMVQLFLVIIGSMGFNASVLAQQPPKIMFNLFIASIAISLLTLILNLL